MNKWQNGDYQCKCTLTNMDCTISVNNLPHPCGGTFPAFACDLSINDCCLEKTCICNVGGKEKPFVLTE